ncbi:hypothetical protein [Nocardia spumae]|uniref:hypothetical protein n=1 Tax=Nocardia spumae TaxID=2887190 RepID=UPI001D139F82|nr:hypothetical protein [Nocardia spumae]
MVYPTGVLELLGAAGMALTATRRRAALGVVALFAVMLPANIHAALAVGRVHGRAGGADVDCALTLTTMGRSRRMIRAGQQAVGGDQR